jgi:hypothetical protein
MRFYRFFKLRLVGLQFYLILARSTRLECKLVVVRELLCARSDGEFHLASVPAKAKGRTYSSARPGFLSR